MNRFTHLNASMKPLVEVCEIPTEKIPEPTWIEVSKEEYDKMFQPVHGPFVNMEVFPVDYLRELLMKKQDKTIRDMLNSSQSSESEEV